MNRDERLRGIRQRVCTCSVMSPTVSGNMPLTVKKKLHGLHAHDAAVRMVTGMLFETCKVGTVTLLLEGCGTYLHARMVIGE